jgi:Flp pilus assembly protein TadD
MRIWLAVALYLSAPFPILAAPAEDHWSVEAPQESAADLAESARLIEAENYRAALPILERLAKDLPANADVFNLLGFAHRKTGNLALSGAHYRRALHLQPNHLGALEYQGELFLLQGDVEAAKANLRRLEAVCPTDCEERDELAEAIRDWKGQ